MYKCNSEYIHPLYQEEIIEYTQKRHFIDKDLDTISYENGYILPSHYFFCGGVLDQNGKSVQQGCFNERYEAGILPEKEEIFESDDTVIFLGFLHNVWGHCLMDGIKKLWFLQTAECKTLLSKGAKLVYITPESKELKSHAVEFLKLAGFDINSAVFINKPTRFKKIIVPDNSLICSQTDDVDKEEYFYTKEFVQTYKLIKNNIDSYLDNTYSSFKKVYLTRTGFKNGLRDMGESSLEHVFKKEGYTIKSPEKLSFVDQVSLMQNCDTIATTEGSISHNAIFCKPQTKLILLRKSYYINGYQAVINEIADLDVTYIDAHNSIPFYQYTKVGGPFYMCITPELERFIGHKIFHLPLWMRPSWWWYCNRNRKIVHRIKSIFSI